MSAGPRSTKKSTIVKACLAGGLVLGVGAAVTLAAWQDDVFSKGTFTAGHFNVQGSTDGGASWDEYNTAGGAADLQFTLAGDQLQYLSPDDTVYAPFALHTEAGTSNGADISLEAVTGDGGTILPHLTYTLVQTADATCDAAAVTAATSTVVAAGTAITTGAAAGTTAFSLDPAPAAGGDGAAVDLCFAVTADGTLEQDQTGSVTWDFHATSNDTVSQ